MGISSLNNVIHLPPDIAHSSAPARLQLQFVHCIASEIVEHCTLIDVCGTGSVNETNGKVYNYARVLCHYGALVTEFKDAWHFGDGEREYQCWRVLQPHFKASGRTKYSLEALRLQFQVKSLSASLSCQIVWDRFVNSHGGIGRNIPCDLYNEHIVKLIKDIIANMGPNLTLQRAARSSSTLHLVCKQFDDQSNVPVTAHSTKGDKVDTQKVVTAVLNNLLNTVPGR